MSTDRHVTLFHSPNTRSTGTLIMLEELGADYDLHVLNIKAAEQLAADYVAINPMGKVPAIQHGDALITEQAAIYMYLADLYPEAGLAPVIGDPLRGPYLRWMVFYGSCFEPALIDFSQKRDPAPRGLSPYGDYATVIKAVNDQLAKGPYILGDKFTAADVLWGIALNWTTKFKLLEVTPVIREYIDRIVPRPAVRRARAKDLELLAAQTS